MTTYVYETVPSREDEKPRYYEIRQSMSEPALTRHPETGEPIRRVILGGYGVLSRNNAGETSSGCGCGPAGCCN